RRPRGRAMAAPSPLGPAGWSCLPRVRRDVLEGRKPRSMTTSDNRAAQPFGISTVLSYPRIGPDRELKRAVEAYWAGRIDPTALHEQTAALRAQAWHTMRDARLGSIPSNTFSLYDHVLDTAVMVDAIPD